MVIRALSFDDGPPFVPSREYAASWADTAPAYWERFIAAYRERVTEVYATLAQEHYDRFRLALPTAILTVACLAREWTFFRRSDHDQVIVRELWEHPALARSDLYARADHEDVVRQVAQIGPEWELLYSLDFANRVDVQSPRRVDGGIDWWAHEFADADAGSAIEAPRLERLIRGLQGRDLDDDALAALRVEFAGIADLAGAPRGRRFEAFVVDLLRAHGCRVEQGKARIGEQVDIFVEAPFRAIIETRWSKQRLSARELGDLTRKLRKRPAIVAGIYVSMGGFTADARAEAAEESSGHTVLLWDSADLAMLLDGQKHAADLFDDGVSDVIRRYVTHME